MGVGALQHHEQINFPLLRQQFTRVLAHICLFTCCYIHLIIQLWSEATLIAPVCVTLLAVLPESNKKNKTKEDSSYCDKLFLTRHAVSLTRVTSDWQPSTLSPALTNCIQRGKFALDNDLHPLKFKANFLPESLMYVVGIILKCIWWNDSSKSGWNTYM